MRYKIAICVGCSPSFISFAMRAEIIFASLSSSLFCRISISLLSFFVLISFLPRRLRLWSISSFAAFRIFELER